MSGQSIVLTVELFLDDVVPLPQALYQCLVVGDKELDVLPILARLLFETVTWRVSGPSRKATLSLICLAEASRPDLASPAYSRPSRVPLRSPFTISS